MKRIGKRKFHKTKRKKENLSRDNIWSDQS